MTISGGKVIFLDLDGVLNNLKYLKEHLGDLIPLDPKRIGFLKEIIRRTQAKVVLTSSWRFNPELDDFFSKAGIGIERTRFLNEDREKEILTYVRENQISSFIILDDEISHYTNKDTTKYLIRTLENEDIEERSKRDDIEGLQEKHIDWACAMLNKKEREN